MNMKQTTMFAVLAATMFFAQDAEASLGHGTSKKDPNPCHTLNTLTLQLEQQTGEDPKNALKGLTGGPMFGQLEMCLQVMSASADPVDPNDMRELEKAINAINQLYRELGVVVQKQGEMIDNIQRNIEGTKENLRAGNGNVQKSSKSIMDHVKGFFKRS